MKFNLAHYYEAAIQRGEIKEDLHQRAVLIHMQGLADALEQSKTSWLPWKKPPLIKGLYLYGPVGVGKTYLIDLFFEQVHVQKKARFHFHHFMQQVDIQLRQVQGRKDPLQKIAKNMAQTISLLCFDEFLVHDVAYAMILAELLQALHANGVILVISSNTKPDDLYLNGVQRERFLPAINLINTCCDVLLLDEKIDYRLGRTIELNTYLYPLDEQTHLKMKQQFALLTQKVILDGFVTIQKREIPFIQKGQKSIWFDFNVLCNLPRSQLDYLELADAFDNLFISGIPELTENHTAQVIMFIHLIDVMYDRGIKVVLSAQVPLERLYIQGEMGEVFKRTLSRLTEMQSVDYLSRHPKRISHTIY